MINILHLQINIYIFIKNQINENMKKYCLNADIKKRKKPLQTVLADSVIHVTNVKSTSANDNNNS